jgi:integrase
VNLGDASLLLLEIVAMRCEPELVERLREAARADDRSASAMAKQLGYRRLSEVQRGDVQDLADRLLAEGLDPSTVRNMLMPLRAIFRRAVIRGELAVSPCTALALPAARGRRERVAEPSEAARLLDALPAGDRALWGTAMYGGLRRGELQALRWEDVDLAGGVIRVQRSWDQLAGVIEVKSRAGARTVPIVTALRRLLIEHKLMRSASSTEISYVFTTASGRPFDPGTITARADRAWLKAGLERITLHECRHTAASMMIAAGLNAKTVSTFLGHSSISITMDRYGHLFPGSESEAAGLLDAYLARATTA